MGTGLRRCKIGCADFRATQDSSTVRVGLTGPELAENENPLNIQRDLTTEVDGMLKEEVDMDLVLLAYHSLAPITWSTIRGYVTVLCATLVDVWTCLPCATKWLLPESPSCYCQALRSPGCTP